MLNLEPRNEIRVQTPEEDNKILFLNEDGDLVLKDDAGDIKYVTISDVKPPKVYKALLSQSGTDAPTAIVLENTLGGEVVWTRDQEGVYFGTLANAFDVDKQVLSISFNGENYATTDKPAVFLISQGTNDVIVTTSKDGVLTDGVVDRAPITIEVYP